MISKFNTSQFKLMRPRKGYTGASKNSNSQDINTKAKELMDRHPTMTRQMAYLKAREFCNKWEKKILNSVAFNVHHETVRSLAASYKKNQGMSNRQAYRQACMQLVVS